ncbi:MAG TPA: DUF167 domain-containing protein [Candidatus Saccharimonadales bacterium]
MMQYVIHVKPGSKKGPLIEQDDSGALTLFVRERAVDGKANDAVIALLAVHLGVPKSRIAIVRGHAARIKMVRVDD